MDNRIVDLAERVAALEQQAIQGQRDRNEMMHTLDSIRNTQQEEADNLSALTNKISKWEGKFGGVIFILACLWAFFSGTAGALMEWIKLGGGR